MTSWQRLRYWCSAIFRNSFVAYLEGAILGVCFFFGANVLVFLIIAELDQPAIWSENFTLASAAKSFAHAFIIGPFIGILFVRDLRSRKSSE